MDTNKERGIPVGTVVAILVSAVITSTSLVYSISTNNMKERMETINAVNNRQEIDLVNIKVSIATIQTTLENIRHMIEQMDKKLEDQKKGGSK